MGGLMGGTTDLVALSIAIFRIVAFFAHMFRNKIFGEHAIVWEFVPIWNYLQSSSSCVTTQFWHFASIQIMLIWQYGWKSIVQMANEKYIPLMQFTQFSSLVTVSFHSWNFCPKIHPTSCSSGYIWVKRSDVRGYRYTCSSSLKSTQPPFRRHLRRSTTKIRQIYAHCYIWSLQYFKWAVVFSGFDTWKIMWLMILG